MRRVEIVEVRRVVAQRELQAAGASPRVRVVRLEGGELRRQRCSRALVPCVYERIAVGVEDVSAAVVVHALVNHHDALRAERVVLGVVGEDERVGAEARLVELGAHLVHSLAHHSRRGVHVASRCGVDADVRCRGEGDCRAVLLALYPEALDVRREVAEINVVAVEGVLHGVELRLSFYVHVEHQSVLDGGCV